MCVNASDSKEMRRANSLKGASRRGRAIEKNGNIGTETEWKCSLLKLNGSEMRTHLKGKREVYSFTHDKVENVLHFQVTSTNENRYIHQAKRNSDLQSVHA